MSEEAVDAPYRGYWLRFTGQAVEVRRRQRGRVLGSFSSASLARKHVRELRRAAT